MIGASALLAAQLAAAPIALDEALQEAARANPDLRVARAQAEAAGADVTAAWAGVLPRLDLSASFGRDFIGPQRSVNTVPTGVDPVTGELRFARQVVETPSLAVGDHAYSLTLELPLFDGMRSWNAIARARAAERAAGHDLDETSLAVAFEVTRRFYELVKAEESLRVLVETAERSEQILRRAEALFAAGRGPKSEILAARVNLQNDRISVEAQRARAAGARADLAFALGRESGEGLEVLAPAAVTGAGLPLAGEPPEVAELLARARRTRSLLAARRDGAAAAELDVAVARGGYWPIVGAQASYAKQGVELFGPDGVFGDPQRQYFANAQLFVRWNLFEGRRTSAGVEGAEQQARRALARADQAVQQVAAEIARARSAVVALARSAALAQEALEAAAQGVALARDRLDAGTATQLEVRDASLKLTQAKLSLVNARVDWLVARADLSRAVGGAL